MSPTTVTTLTPDQGLLAAVRAGCGVLRDAPAQVRAVSVFGELGTGSTALPLLERAEALAREFGCSMVMHLSGDTYEIQFARIVGHEHR